SGFVAPFAIPIDAGDPIVLLAGVHPGCFELFATDRVRTVRDLQGKAVAVQAIGSSQHAFTATIVAHVGLDPRRDISWVTHPAPEQSRCGCSPTARSTPISAFHPSPTSFGPAVWGASF